MRNLIQQGNFHGPIDLVITRFHCISDLFIMSFYCNRPYAYDVTEGHPCVLGVKRSTATCAIAKHAVSGPTPACHTAGLARARALTERLSANALCQHNTCAQRDKSWPPTWRRRYGNVTSVHKVYCISASVFFPILHSLILPKYSVGTLSVLISCSSLHCISFISHQKKVLQNFISSL